MEYLVASLTSHLPHRSYELMKTPTEKILAEQSRTCSTPSVRLSESIGIERRARKPTTAQPHGSHGWVDIAGNEARSVREATVGYTSRRPVNPGRDVRLMGEAQGVAYNEKVKAPWHNIESSRP